MIDVAPDDYYDLLVTDDLWPKDDLEQPVHELVVGGTQFGKSTYVEDKCRKKLEKYYGAISVIWLDPQRKKSGWSFYQRLLGLGLDDLVIFESLGDIDSVIPWDNLIASKAKHPHQRDKEDKKTVEQFLDPLIRQREFTSLTDHALIKQWAENWAWLMLKQKTRKPLAEGIWVFRPGTPSWKRLIEDCKDYEFSNRFRYLPTHPATLERMCAPALRLFDPIFNCPAVKLRDGMGKGFDIGAGLNSGMNFIFEGGDASEEEIGFWLRRIALQVIDYKKRGGKQRVILVLEEAEAYRMIGPMEVKALKTLLFAGLTIIIICQTPWFMDEEITRDVLQNTPLHCWFNCPNSEIASLAAKDLQGFLDPWMIHSYRQRQRIIGEKAIQTESVSRREGSREILRREGSQSVSRNYGDYSSPNRITTFEPSTTIRETSPSETITTSTQYRPVYEDNEEPVYMSLTDQERLLAISIMGYDRGECAMKYMGRTFQQQLKKPKEPWEWESLAQLKAAEHLALLKTKAPFMKPRLPDPKQSNGSGGHKAGQGNHRGNGKQKGKQSYPGTKRTR